MGLKHKHLTTGEIGKPANYEFFSPSNMQERTALQSPGCHTNDCHTIWELFYFILCVCVCVCSEEEEPVVDKQCKWYIYKL